MKKRNLVLALCAIGSISLAGCNDDDSDNNFSSTSGDTIILTSDGMISSINKMLQMKLCPTEAYQDCNLAMSWWVSIIARAMACSTQLGC